MQFYFCMYYCKRQSFMVWIQIDPTFYLSAPLLPVGKQHFSDSRLKTSVGYRRHDVTFLCNSGELNWLRVAGSIDFTPESASEINNWPKTNCPGCGREAAVGLQSDCFFGAIHGRKIWFWFKQHSRILTWSNQCVPFLQMSDWSWGFLKNRIFKRSKARWHTELTVISLSSG